jgi:hypothetical protein
MDNGYLKGALALLIPLYVAKATSFNLYHQPAKADCNEYPYDIQG